MAVQNLIMLFGVPLIALFIAAYVKIPLFYYIGVYLLGATSLFVGTYSAMGFWPAMIQLGFTILGAIIAVVTIGFMGEKASQRSYMVLLASLGLFPWVVAFNGNMISFWTYLVVLVCSILFAQLMFIGRKSIKNRDETKKPRIIMSLPVIAGFVLASVIFIF